MKKAKMSRNWNLFFELVKRDFSRKYMNSYFGLIWVFLEPLINLVLLWFVFSHGLKGGAQLEIPYILYIFSGLIVFNFFSLSLTSGSRALTDFPYLVTQVDFPLALLPLVKITSSLLIHLFLVAFLLIISVAYGYYPNLNWLLLVYGIVSACVFCYSLALVFAILSPFFPDINNIIGVCLRLIYWLCPIIWALKMIPDRYSQILIWNPITIIIFTFRRGLYTFADTEQFWNLNCFLWILSLGFLLFGRYLFRRLRPHLGDVVT